MFFLALFGVFVSKANDDRVTQDDFLEQYNSLVERYNLDVNNGIKIGSSSSNVELSNDDKVYQSMRLIVKSKSETLPSMGANEVISGYNNLHIYQFDSIENTKKAHIELEKLSNVDYVDIDIKFEIGDSSISGYDDDFSYSTWGYDDMGIDVYSQMLKSKYPEQMEQVVVAVMDTGIDTDHSWFKDRIYDGGRNFSSTNSWDINNYEDGHGHGTHVSGTIVDLTLSNVQILPIKVMDDGGNGYLYQILNGIEYVIGLKEDGVNIVAMNFSIGGYCYETTDYDSYNELLTKAYNLGMLSVVASGNNGDDVDNYIPAKVEKAITVAAIGSESSGSYYSPAWSNYGSTVDVCAPGVNIVSASIDGETVSNQGTSMATPHVTAVVALLSSDTESNLDVAQIISVINNSAIDLGSIGWDKYYGYGLVNITYGSIEKLPDVTFSREDGECSEQFQLTLTINNNDSTPNTDAVIFYTLDGSEPSTDSTKYTSPITINETTIVKAVAYELDSMGTIKAFGRVKTITYYFYGQDLESAFVVSDDGVLSKYNGVLQDIIVPETINSITIVEIGSEAFLGKNIISISLPNTVKTIGSSAFENCSYLERIYAPGVVDIDGFAFNGCVSLLYVDNDHFPALVNIGMAAFQNCKSINSIELDYVEVVEGYAFNYCNSKSLINVHLENVEIIGDYAFHRCIYIEKINMPKVVKVSTSAFEDNSLTIVNLPNLEYLGNSAFRGNDYIGTVALPECKVIGSWTFYECRNLKNLEIPKAEYIHYGAFAYCNSIEELSLPKAKEIHSSAFVELIYITELYLPEAEYIGFGAFENCLSVLEIELPKVERIEKYAFAGLSSLETVILSSVINSIDNDAF